MVSLTFFLHLIKLNNTGGMKMTNEQHNVQIRNASLQDVDLLTDIEAACFPAAEAATREAFAQRLRYYARHFGLLK